MYNGSLTFCKYSLCLTEKRCQATDLIILKGKNQNCYYDCYCCILDSGGNITDGVKLKAYISHLAPVAVL